MAKKNTCRATEIKRKLAAPLILYEIHLKTGDIVHVSCNVVEDRDDHIEFLVEYTSRNEEGDSTELVGMFREWDYFIKVEKSFKEKIDGIKRLCEEGEIN